MKKYKLICCEVLKREVEYCLKETTNHIDIEYTKKSAHRNPENLKKELQDLIDNTKEGYEAIILGFGLCGNTVNGIKAPNIPVIIPKAHDCCTLYLGSRKRYNKLFEANKSMPWGTTGYCEIDYDHDDFLGFSKEYEEFVEKYGEDNARYIWDILHPESKSDKALFIVIPETFSQKVYDDFMQKTQEENLEIEKVDGDMVIIRKMLSGNWDEDFLIVDPGHQIEAKYDSDDIIDSILK